MVKLACYCDVTFEESGESATFAENADTICVYTFANDASFAQAAYAKSSRVVDTCYCGVSGTVTVSDARIKMVTLGRHTGTVRTMT